MRGGYCEGGSIMECEVTVRGGSIMECEEVTVRGIALWNVKRLL